MHPARKRTQQERKQESEQKILRAAVDLIARNGYSKTTLAEIGKAAGYTGALVTHRFGSKEGLLRAVVAVSAVRFLDEKMRSTQAEQSARESLDKYIETYLSGVLRQDSRFKALYVIMGEALGGVPQIREDIARLNEHFREILTKVIRRGVNNGEFRQDIDPEETAFSILGTIRGVTMQLFVQPDAIDPTRVVAMVQASAATSVKPNPSPVHSLRRS